MNDFKLLGIRPLSGCNTKFMKALEPKRLYRFYADFDVDQLDSHLSERILSFKSDLPPNFYLLKYPKKEVQLSISAIVGKNGSGKSSLIDLLFVFIYNFSLEKKILKNRSRKSPLQYEEDIHLELFYQQGDYMYGIHMDSGKNDPENRLKPISTIHRYRAGEDGQWHFDGIERGKTNVIAEYFFYTIAVNYSIYGLNSEQLGDWIKWLFHKNDVYQTPIVINPFRSDGNININRENELVYQRLLANVLTPVEDNVDESKTLRNIAKGKVAKSLTLTLKKKKLDEYRESLTKHSIENGINCLVAFYFSYTSAGVLGYSLGTVEDDIANYLIFKLKKICIKYDDYNDFFSNNNFQNIDRFVKALIADDSHVTFKLKQAANLLLFYDKIQETFDDNGRVNINKYSKFVREALHDENYKRPRQLRPIELIPPSIYDIKIFFDDQHTFDDLSSGEKQKIYGISSIVYHLINLNSVFQNKSEERKLAPNSYSYVNVIFDEIELYFHPDFQRRFIYDLTDYLMKVNQELVWYFSGINMLFITHSPFILSDIPTQNVLYLEVNKHSKTVKTATPKGQTFGANIHDLLANEFFMEDGFMGEFALQKIKSAIDFLKGEKIDTTWGDKSVKQFIDLLGEPLIKKSMLDLYFSVFGRDAVQQEIDRLNRLMERMNK